jgi:hypothetical protein
VIRNNIMPQQIAYKSLDLYSLSKKLVLACYELTQELPPEEKTNFSRYIRTAALDFYMTIARSAFLKPKKRKKAMRGAKNALIIIDAATRILTEVGFVTPGQTDVIATLSSSCYQLLDEG